MRSKRPSPILGTELLYGPGSYLTDGTRLFRVGAWLRASAAEALVELEDCRSLNLSLWEPAELRRLGMRVVRRGGETAPATPITAGC